MCPNPTCCICVCAVYNVSEGCKISFKLYSERINNRGIYLPTHTHTMQTEKGWGNDFVTEPTSCCHLLVTSSYYIIHNTFDTLSIL